MALFNTNQQRGRRFETGEPCQATESGRPQEVRKTPLVLFASGRRFENVDTELKEALIALTGPCEAHISQSYPHLIGG